MRTQPIPKSHKNPVGNQCRSQTRGPDLNEILKDICLIFDEDIYGVLTGGNKEKYCRCKRIYCQVASEITDATLKQIGIVINKDHTTVIHHLQKVKDWTDSKDELFLRDWEKYITLSPIWKQYSGKI